MSTKGSRWTKKANVVKECPLIYLSLSWSFLQVLSLGHVESFRNIGVQVYDEISVYYFNQLQDGKPVECDVIG